jgi:adenine-specific DNA-methyltransferase
MHQFVEAGIALYNPDEPDRPVNSPLANYQISEEAFEVVRTFGTNGWEAALALYSKERKRSPPDGRDIVRCR